MNIPAGASDIISPPQPETPEIAVARMEQLKTDAAFQARIVARDATAFAEHTRLWRIAHGMTPEPQAPVNTVDVMKETIGRDLAEAQTRAEGLRACGLNETQIYEYLNDRPIPFEERQKHERKLSDFEKDTAFKQRLLAGDPDARYEWRRVHLGLSMQVGTQEQIAEWEAAHRGRKPT